MFRNDGWTAVIDRSVMCMLLIMLYASLLCVAAAPPNVLFSVGETLHKINKLYRGCHSDSGFTHQVRGFYSQMIFGESFEKPQQNATKGVSADAWAFVPCGAGCVASSEIINHTIAPAHHGASSRKITIYKAAAAAPQQQSLALPFAGLRNRALANEGMYLEAGKPYEGYFFARCAAPVKLGVRLENYMTNETLAEQTFDFACGEDSSAWVKLDFTLTPKAGTQCTGIAVGSDPAIPCTRPTNEAGHACIRCDGQFVVGLYGVGSVGIDYVFLQPGAWGRVNGLPVRKTAGDTLSEMGVTVMRVGGSFASVTGWPDGGGGTPPSTTSGEYYQCASAGLSRSRDLWLVNRLAFLPLCPPLPPLTQTSPDRHPPPQGNTGRASLGYGPASVPCGMRMPARATRSSAAGAHLR